MKRHISMILTLALLFVSFGAIFSSTIIATDVSAEISVDDSLDIAYGNLMFKDSVYLRYAVSTEKYSENDIVLLIWTAPKTNVDEYTYGSQNKILTYTNTTEIDSSEYAVFDYKDLSARQMTDNVYARAYIPASGGEAEIYGDVVKYSVLQYCYNMLGKTSDTPTSNEKLIKLLNATLAYGAAAQEYADYKTATLATDDFYQIKLVGGTLEDGFSHGLYKQGTDVIISAPTTLDNGEKVFDSWTDKDGNVISTDASYTLTVGESNQTYTANYTDNIVYSQGLAYSVNDDGTTCTITGMGTCTDTELYIPPVIDGYKVTIIGDSAFYEERSITYVSIPYGVTIIDDEAFFYCGSLANIELPDTLTSIGAGAFTSNIFTTLELPDSITHIGEGAFAYCTLLTSVTLPKNITVLERCTFSTCRSLTSITIPEGVTTISDHVFYYCKNLKTIYIPLSVTYIDNGALGDCTSLESIYYAGTISQWWNNMERHMFGDRYSSNDYVVRCSDGAFGGTSVDAW